jgi:hypothetical protein
MRVTRKKQGGGHVVARIGRLLIVEQAFGYWLHDPELGADVSGRIATQESAEWVARDRQGLSHPEDER